MLKIFKAALRGKELRAETAFTLSPVIVATSFSSCYLYLSPLGCIYESLSLLLSVFVNLYLCISSLPPFLLFSPSSVLIALSCLCHFVHMSVSACSRVSSSQSVCIYLSVVSVSLSVSVAFTLCLAFPCVCLYHFCPVCLSASISHPPFLTLCPSLFLCYSSALFLIPIMCSHWDA